MYGKDARITNNPIEFAASDLPKINYSIAAINDIGLHIQPFGLLFETEIKPIEITCTIQNGITCFFQNKSDLGFDILSAIFYCISRYEEYLSTDYDKYGRFNFENSLAYKNQFIQLPLVDIWLKEMSHKMTEYFPNHPIKKHSFIFQPTYDIDMARSYESKKWDRKLGGMAKDILKGNFKKLIERLLVLSKLKNDPFNSFEWLNQLHHQYQLNPIYFFLVAARNSALDKNLDPLSNTMQDVMKQHAPKYSIGIHPSWHSHNSIQYLSAEIETLRSTTKQYILRSRQHFLKMTLPQTYQNLISMGIAEDYTMGYAGAHGFRASTSIPFYWFDLSTNKSTKLKIFPFCFMEASAIYYLNETPANTYKQLLNLYSTVQNVDGYFSMIWHNHTLGTSSEFLAWRKIYERFIIYASSHSS